jgi:predicted RNA polymerase sigma factor
MNRAVAVAEWQGPESGLAVLEALAPPAWLAASYLWAAVLADLSRRAGRLDIAQQHRERALTSAPTEAVRELLRRRLNERSALTSRRPQIGER